MIMIDIEMPEKCGECPCFHHDNPMYCQAVKADKNKKIVNPYGVPRPEWYPLKEHEADRWIPVNERLPEEKETIFAKFKNTDKWEPAMFERMSDNVRVVAVFADGTRRVNHSHTVDGKWERETNPMKRRTVTHWMPNPELPNVDKR